MKRISIFPGGTGLLLVTSTLLMMAIMGCQKGTTAKATPFEYCMIASNTAAWITDYTGTGGVVTIPAEIEGRPVTGLDYFNCSNVIAVIFPRNLSWINQMALPTCPCYFEGNAPDACPIQVETNVAIYFLSGTTNWGTNFCGRPTAIWLRSTNDVSKVKQQRPRE